MKKLLLHILMGLIQPVWSQSVEWQRQFSVGTSLSMVSGVVGSSDFCSYAAIAARKWGYTPTSGGTPLGIGLAKVINATGDTVFVKRLNGWTSGIPQMKIHKSFEDNLVIASKSVGDTIFNSKILVQKVDTNGNTIWILPLSNGLQNPQIKKVLAAPDGGTFILGSDLSTSGGFMDWLLIKVSYEGQFMWSQRYSGGTNWYCEANNIEPLRNGNYLISGMAERSIWSVEVDTDGNQISQRVIYETPQPYLIFGAQTAQGYHKSYYSFGVVQSNPRRLYFSKKDSLFQTVWGGEQINLLGKYYASTVEGYSLLVSGKATTTDSMYLNFIRNDSLILWRKALPRTGLFPTNALINDVAFDRNGNVVLCGTSKRPASTRDELFFMKISGIGLPYDPFADTVLVTNKSTFTEKKLVVYPNPGREKVWFSGFEGKVELRLFSSEGRLVYQGWVDSGLPVSLSYLPKGLYSYVARQQNQQWTGKWIRE